MSKPRTDSIFDTGIGLRGKNLANHGCRVKPNTRAWTKELFEGRGHSSSDSHNSVALRRLNKFQCDKLSLPRHPLRRLFSRRAGQSLQTICRVLSARVPVSLFLSLLQFFGLLLLRLSTLLFLLRVFPQVVQPRSVGIFGRSSPHSS